MLLVLLMAATPVIAQCPGSPPVGCPPCTQPYLDGAIEGRVSSATDGPGRRASVATDAASRFVIAFETRPSLTALNNNILVRRFNADGTCLGSAAIATTPAAFVGYRDPSVAMNAAGSARLDWHLIFGGTCSVNSGATKRSTLFAFDPGGTPTPLSADTCTDGLGDVEPLVAVSASGTSAAWMRFNTSSQAVASGLVRDPPGSGSPAVVSCDPTIVPPAAPFCYSQWQPCIAQHPDGRFCVAWAQAESAIQGPPFDIAIQQFNATGAAVGALLTVNVPVASFGTSERSPSLSFVGERIVVTWIGPKPADCPATLPDIRVYARQLEWGSAGPVFRGQQFIVDNDPTSQPASIDDANPSVALHGDGETARYAIAWNARQISGSDIDVHARFLDFATTQPLGSEFRLNRTTALTSPPSERIRQVANSAAHTISYPPSGKLLATWTASLVQSAQEVWFTQLPVDAAERVCCSQPCCRGDASGDGLINGDDIEHFLKYLFNRDGFSGPQDECLGLADFCFLDTNGDCVFDDDDRLTFICLLLWDPPNYWRCTPCTIACTPSEGGAAGGGASMPNQGSESEPPHDPSARFPAALALWDCNDKGAPDDRDIADGRSSDCNANGRPDECDLAFDTAVMDCNQNMIPDDCERTPTNQPIPCPTLAAVPPSPEQFAQSFEQFRNWLASLDTTGMKPWQLGYAIKVRLTELGLRYR